MRTLLFALAFGSLAPLLAQNAVPFFEGGYTELRTEAVKQKRPYFVTFYTSWCSWCKKMKATTFEDAGVARLVRAGYLAYRLDAEQGEGIMLARQYGVTGFPTTVFFDAAGTPIHSLSGYLPANEFSKLLIQLGDPKVSERAEAMSHADSLREEWTLEARDVWPEIVPEEGLKTYDKSAQFAAGRDHFGFSEERYALGKTGRMADMVRLDLAYFAGRRQWSHVREILVNPEAGRLTIPEQVYFGLLLVEEGQADILVLRTAHRLVEQKPSLESLAFLALIQQLQGDQVQSQKNAKKALKKGKKQKQSAAYRLVTQLAVK